MNFVEVPISVKKLAEGAGYFKSLLQVRIDLFQLESSLSGEALPPP